MVMMNAEREADLYPDSTTENEEISSNGVNKGRESRPLEDDGYRNEKELRERLKEIEAHYQQTLPSSNNFRSAGGLSAKPGGKA
ncbi:MAG: hypothetical protein JRI22_04150 [Deltaproteobacteria bacterium]|nr:hypothetical protein [Deltaproteobacteria bacterium]